MRKTIYQTNFDRLVKLGIVRDGQLRANGRSQSGGFMDLVFEKLPYLDGFNGQACTAFSIAHYFKQNGDLCQDPEMVVPVHPDLQIGRGVQFPAGYTPDLSRSVPGTG